MHLRRFMATFEIQRVMKTIGKMGSRYPQADDKWKARVKPDDVNKGTPWLHFDNFDQAHEWVNRNISEGDVTEIAG
jgi:hypothetical protein